jgi:tRNA(fMet)-specific endonuclease VapC
MIRFVMDTDTFTLFCHQHVAVVAHVDASLSETAVTTITVEEQFGGWFAKLQQSRSPTEYARTSRRIATTARLLSLFQIPHMSEPALARFDSLRKLKLNVGRMDLRIAAIALEQNAAVGTRNARDFGRVPGLTIVDWSV